MELRVYRTFRWELAVSMSEARIGGRNPMKLKATDELQYRDADGAWKPIPLVETPRPEHPHDIEDRERGEEISQAMARSLKDMVCYHCRKPVGQCECHPKRTENAG